MGRVESIREQARVLRLGYLVDNLQGVLHEATINSPCYSDFLADILANELESRSRRDYQRRLKAACLPRSHDLDDYDFRCSNSIGMKQMKQLRELLWVDQLYNLVIMGPSGTGKTYMAAGLVNDAIKVGYRAYFVTMSDLLDTIRQKQIKGKAAGTWKRYLKAQLIAIDDIMMFPVEKGEAVELFNFINYLHERCSLIITTNKSPVEWAEMLDDEVLATAILDRVLYRCEVLKLEGEGYRMSHRQTFMQG